jgi:PAS domain S-box-containing protein
MADPEEDQLHPQTLRLKVEHETRDEADADAADDGGGGGESAPEAGVLRPERGRRRVVVRRRPPAARGLNGGPLYRKLLQSIYDATLVTDEEGRVIDANRRAQEFFRYEKEEMLGLSLADLISGFDETLMSMIRENTDRFALVEAHGVRKDATVFPAEIAVSTLARGRFTAYILMVRNVTIRRKSEAQLRTSHNALRNASNGVVITDETGRIEYVNPAFAEMLGHEDTGGFLHQDLRGLFEDRALLSEVMSRVMEQRGSWIGELAALNGNGERGQIVVQTAVACNRSIDGEPAGLVFSFVDVTARKQAQAALQRSHEELERRVAERTAELAERNTQLQEQLRKLEAAKAQEKALQERLARAERMESLGLLAGGVAHDLNNILGPIVALPSLIRHELRALETGSGEQLVKMEEELTMLEDAAVRASATLRDLSILSRRGHSEKRPVNLNDVVNSYLGQIEHRELKASMPGVRMKVELAGHLPSVAGSALNLGRVLSNLVRNGYEAMENGGDLGVRTCVCALDQPFFGDELIDPGLYAVLEVSDTGSGMSQEGRRRVFEPFFTTKHGARRSGTGLGLSIVHGLVKDHGGFIDLKTQPGKGTVFVLYFPVIDDDGLAAEPQG